MCSPLFNLYLEKTFAGVPSNAKKGISNGKLVNNVRYAKNALILTNSNGQLQTFVERLLNKVKYYIIIEESCQFHGQGERVRNSEILAYLNKNTKKKRTLVSRLS